MTIWLAGDFAPTQNTVGARFDINVATSDLVIVNLETPITRGLEPRPKAGPSLNGFLEPLETLASMTKVVAVFANNHAMDYGMEGVNQTVAACSSIGVEIVGVGHDLESALTPLVVEHGGLKVGIAAFAESQFGMATTASGGVAPLLPGRCFEIVRELKSQTDLVIVSADGGAEMSPWPSPRRIDMMRLFAKSGADFVHGHHAHVPQGFEAIDDGVIFYGLGNFLVDPANWSGLSNSKWSIMPKIEYGDPRPMWSTAIATIKEEPGHVEVNSGTEDERVARSGYIEACNIPLKDPALLAALWQEISISLYERYFQEWLGFKNTRPNVSAQLRYLSRPIRRMLKVGSSTHEREIEMLRYHLFACESHCEAIATALGVLSGELPNLVNANTRRIVASMSAVGTEYD